MANYGGGFTAYENFTADEDLTGQQWKLVKAASTVGNVASATSSCAPMPIGILANDPSSGQEALVAVFGFIKAKGRVNACFLSHGVFVSPASDGFVEPALGTAGTEPIFGRWFGPRVTTVDASLLGNTFIMPVPACIGASQGAGY